MTVLPRVVILTANAGGGHRSAAQSLAEALAERAAVTVLDLLDDHAPFPLNRLSAAYGPLVARAPWAWRMLYQSSARPQAARLTERMIFRVAQARFTPPLLAAQPDLIISVHGMQVNVVLWALRAAGWRGHFMTVVTDPVSVSAAWLSPEVDLSIVASEAARATALAYGLPAERVRVIGLPIRQAFLAARELTKAAARQGVGLDPDRPMVLLAGGGYSGDSLLPLARTLAERLAGHAAQPQLVVIAGRNLALQRRLCAEPWARSAHVLGFVENMAEWLAAADLLVTKAGPGTLAEAACLGVPALITDFIPGQEAGNVAWVVSSGAGLFERDAGRCAALVADLLQPGDARLGQMARQARGIARPDASQEIAAAGLGLLGL